MKITFPMVLLVALVLVNVMFTAFLYDRTVKMMGITTATFGSVSTSLRDLVEIDAFLKEFSTANREGIRLLMSNHPPQHEPAQRTARDELQ